MKIIVHFGTYKTNVFVTFSMRGMQLPKNMYNKKKINFDLNILRPYMNYTVTELHCIAMLYFLRNLPWKLATKVYKKRVKQRAPNRCVCTYDDSMYLEFLWDL